MGAKPPIQPASEPPPPLVPREWHLRLDPLLLLASLGLVAASLVALKGATANDVPGSPDYYVIRQGIYAGVGLAVLAAATLIDPDYYRRYWRVVFGGTVALMLIVFVAGTVTRGSRRWLDARFVSFKPAE